MARGLSGWPQFEAGAAASLCVCERIGPVMNELRGACLHVRQRTDGAAGGTHDDAGWTSGDGPAFALTKSPHSHHTTQGASMKKHAHITGEVEYREGDGPNITIRKGPCEVEASALDVTISWTDAQTHGAAAIPLADYQRYVASQAIEVDGVRSDGAAAAKSSGASA